MEDVDTKADGRPNPGLAVQIGELGKAADKILRDLQTRRTLYRQCDRDECVGVLETNKKSTTFGGLRFETCPMSVPVNYVVVEQVRTLAFFKASRRILVARTLQYLGRICSQETFSGPLCFRWRKISGDVSH